MCSPCRARTSSGWWASRLHRWLARRSASCSRSSWRRIRWRRGGSPCPRGMSSSGRVMSAMGCIWWTLVAWRSTRTGSVPSAGLFPTTGSGRSSGKWPCWKTRRVPRRPEPRWKRSFISSRAMTRAASWNPRPSCSSRCCRSSARRCATSPSIICRRCCRRSGSRSWAGLPGPSSTTSRTR